MYLTKFDDFANFLLNNLPTFLLFFVKKSGKKNQQVTALVFQKNRSMQNVQKYALVRRHFCKPSY